MWTDVPTWKSINFILENIYYLSGIALFIVGIKQIQTSSKGAKSANKREAITLTTQQCDEFHKKLLPLIENIEEQLNDNNIPLNEYFRNLPKNHRREVLLDDKELLENIINVLKNNKKFVNDYFYVTNLFEVFSAYFVEGVADSEIAYKIIGTLYCNNVTTLFPIIVSTLKVNDKAFPSIRKLYSTWQSLIIEEEATKDYQLAKENKKEQFETLGT